MMDPRIAERYDGKMAKSFLGTNDKLTGLPEFLGIHLTGFEPGRLTAEMVVHDRLLTPFGNMHGGVISAVCDHVLGCEQRWARVCGRSRHRHTATAARREANPPRCAPAVATW